MSGPRALDLTATSDLRTLNVGLSARPCHKSAITK